MARLTNLTDRGIETQRALRAVLMALIVEKGWDAVTVKDITERAGIDRSTFYLHYKDKQALFLQAQRQFIDTLLEHVRTQRTPTHALRMLFVAIDQEAPLYRVLLSIHDSTIERTLHRYIVQHITAMLRSTGMIETMDERTQALAANFVATSVRGATKWWLDHERPFSPAVMARKVRALLVGGLSGLRELEAIGTHETPT